MTLLSVEGLSVEFWTQRGTVHAVNGVSFEIAAGETVGIVGESGCGKSVTSLAVLELRRPGDDTAGSRQDPEQRERRHALAAARLADDP